MVEEAHSHVHDLLHEIPAEGLAAVKELFCTQLNYDHVDSPVPCREWSERVRSAVIAPPTILAQHGSALGDFNIVYTVLSSEQRGRGFPLSLTAERLVINQLLNTHHYALFIFSDAEERYWHLVNVRYDDDVTRRRIFRRISIGPEEQLRTASERIAMLDVATIDTDLLGVHPLEIQRRHDEAFDVEAVTDEFFQRYRQTFDLLQGDLCRQSSDPVWSHDFALQFLNRIMFLYYVQRKRWLGNDPDFLRHFWQVYTHSEYPDDTFVQRWLNTLFFEAFNNRFKPGATDEPPFPEEVCQVLVKAPFLNGGLFERNKLDHAYTPQISDDLFEQVLNFLKGYNFTISEDTPLDQEVAVDPEMIGKVYESLVNVSEEADDRGEAGIFYTPRVEIDLMCRLSLVDWLSNHLGDDKKNLIYEVVFALGPEEKRHADEAMARYHLWPQLDELLRTITVVDPACGSGSFLVGMLYVLDDLLARADQRLGRRIAPHERKKGIIANSLYGVDAMEWAINVAELRLWLQLVVDTDLELEDIQSGPLLPNLSFRLRSGDSLVQEIGGINFALHKGSGLIPMQLKKRVRELRDEKRRFYNNDPDRAYHSERDLRDRELQLFRDILDGRLNGVEERLTHIGYGLQPQKDLFGEVRPTQFGLDRASLEREQADLQLERDRVAEARDALRTAEDVPFVWDIAFIEIFESDRRGFDVVIGNPPYVRQESIRDPNTPLDEDDDASRRTYKNKLMQSVYTAWPRVFGYDWNAGEADWRLSARSDLYIYFYLFGLSLLNERGVFCFITSNSWLDVGYGKDLQKFLLTRGRVNLVVDNEIRRSFSSAEVNTAIVLLEAAHNGQMQLPGSLAHVVRFVMLMVPFEDVLSPVIWEEVDESTGRLTTPEYRVFPIGQAQMLENGRAPGSNEFAGDKWGAKYLRAPDVYWVLQDRLDDRMVRLGDIADVRRGFTTGANDFFHLDDETVDMWQIEPRFLRKLVKSPRDYYCIDIPDDQTKLYLLWCQTEKSDLQGTQVLEYIRWGEQQGYHKRASCRSRTPWYALSGPDAPDILWPSAFFERHVCYECPRGCVADKVFYTITGPDISLWTRAYLNSSVVALFVEVEGYQLNHGGVFLTTEWLKNLPVLDLAHPCASGVDIEGVYAALSKREILLYEREVHQETRIALDTAVLRGLDLPRTLLPEIHTTVIRYIRNRITKARRGLTRQGR
jgi:hypothetical protein